MATGYLRCASDTSRPDFVNIKNAPGYYYQTLDDTVKIVASSTLGLTLQCAKCHTHKYDPIPQTDYYRVQAIFMSGYRPGAVGAAGAAHACSRRPRRRRHEAKAHNADIDAAIARCASRHRRDLRRQFGERLFAGPAGEAARGDPRRRAGRPRRRRRRSGTRCRSTWPSKFAGRAAAAPPATLPRAARRGVYPATATRSGPLDGADRGRRGEEAARSPRSAPSTTCRARRRRRSCGAATTSSPGPRSRRASCRCWPRPSRSAGRRPPRTRGPAAGGCAFAKWLTQPDHPLTARVLVNRLWLHHFGEGIVATPDNFGRKGAPPSHPELLDWLATEFVARGWSIKAMHRLIMTSAAYRQSSRDDPERHAAAASGRPGQSPALAAAAAAARGRGAARRGAAAWPGRSTARCTGRRCRWSRQGDGEVVTPAGADGQRRSIYLQVRRLAAADAPAGLRPAGDGDELHAAVDLDGVVAGADAAEQRVHDPPGRGLRRPGAARGAATTPRGTRCRLAFGRPATDAERELVPRLPGRAGRPRAAGRPPTRHVARRWPTCATCCLSATSSRTSIERRRGPMPHRLPEPARIAPPDAPRGPVAPGRRLRRPGPGRPARRVPRPSRAPRRDGSTCSRSRRTSRPEGEGGHPALHARRAEPRRSARPQADAGQVRRQGRRPPRSPTTRSSPATCSRARSSSTSTASPAWSSPRRCRTSPGTPTRSPSSARCSPSTATTSRRCG